jgi:hypothetical protein
MVTGLRAGRWENRDSIAWRGRDFFPLYSLLLDGYCGLFNER